MNIQRVVRRSAFFATWALALAPLTGSADQPPGAGEKIVGEVCSGCHGSGLLGAPKIGDSVAWQARFKSAGSVSALTEIAKHGKGNMPPRGGESSLSDSEVQSAIQYMLGKSSVSFQ